MKTFTADLQKPVRRFLPENFELTDWESVAPYFIDLEERSITVTADLEKWLHDMSELEAIISEDVSWRHIRMTCNTEDKKLQEHFTFFMMEIQPKIQPYADRLNRKLIASPLTAKLDHDKYFTYLRSVKKSIDLYREENIPIQSELSVMAQQFGAISGKMTVSVNDKEYTLQQAMKFLESPDRPLREKVYREVQDRRLQDKEPLNKLYSELIRRRHQIARNAGFGNYRDYKFVELGRFDYTKEDCFRFHDSVKQHVLPLVNLINEHKKKKLGLDKLRPWDTEAEPAGVTPLNPFKSGSELLEKTITCFGELRPFFADCLKTMKKMDRFDLESRIGKAPGGYNCPLAETGAPFIFMNAAGQMHDVTTMVHEGGHAIHSFLSHHLDLSAFKEYPMEIAEVASMAMELFSMQNWEVYFNNPEDLKRAKIQQLERVITIFPWIATIDKFQHWVYENPEHSLEERTENWYRIYLEFSSGTVDWSGLGEYQKNFWQKQLHLFEVPFYYIEYGIAQLGAIGLWKQFKKDKETALNNYIAALELGGTKTLPELYAAAGLKFDFSGAYIKELMDFVEEEIKFVF
ncbi:MAG: M3 family oligoendopeptidase [Bacteroidota bacterium]|nr:M3 family oligoendopeptidase [Bacteroidota bacterium]MDP4248849.1 M3 family oligoendopeptidase [Bacteroidota bacterium]